MAPMVTSLFKEMSLMLSDFALGAVKKTAKPYQNLHKQYPPAVYILIQIR